MPGNWSITVRADGEELTAAKYNQDHQDVVDNFTPSGLDDYSASTAQSELKSDPGETGSEALATSLAEELTQLRFIIAEMKGASSWRTTSLSRTIQGDAQIVSSDASSWTAAGTSVIVWKLRLPDGWVSTSDLTFRTLRRAGVSSGTARMTTQIVRKRDNTAPSQLASQDIDFIPGDTNSHILDLTVSGATLAAGDWVNVVITRLGDDAADTMSGAVSYDGHVFFYIGVASR